MEKFGAPEAEIEKAVAEMEKTNQFGFISQVKSWFWSILFYIIVGLLASLAIKKKDPSY